ncbi:MAG: adenylate/guanylate cyclase domain-containing protein [Nanoarchaeota archaeon]
MNEVRLNRLFLLLAFCVILISNVDAKLTLSDDLFSYYNLGDNIKGSVKIENIVDGYYILGASLSCGSFKIDFLRSARDLESGKPVDVVFPDIPINKKMIGACSIKFSIEDFEGKVIESLESKPFIVSDRIDLNFSTDKTSYLPGEVIVVSGNINKTGEYNLSLFLDGEKIVDKSLLVKNFLEKITIDSDFKGEMSVRVYLIDNYLNFADEQVEISVVSVPKKLEILVFNSSILPGETISFKGIIYDQAGESLEGNIIGGVTGPDNSLLEEFNVTSGNSYSFLTKSISPPGKYTVEMKNKDLKSFVNFVVKEVREIEVSFEGNIISFKNIGNTVYNQRGLVDASVGDLVYKVPLTFDLEVGKSVEFDLSKELSQDSYNLSIIGNGKNYSFENKLIEDRREIGKKVSQSVSRILGNTIIDTTSQKNFIFVILLGVVFLASCVYFVNNKIKLKTIHNFEDKMVVKEKHIGELSKNLDVEKEKSAGLAKLFGQYVDTDVLEQQEKIRKIGTEKKEITVMFTDIRGFSAMFSRLDDVKITEFLNPYFKKSHEIINRSGGMVNKFIGDSVMALFNAIKPRQDHIICAVKSAIEIQREVQRFNSELRRNNLDSLKVGIGIDSGSAAVGNLGGEEKVEYTAIGVPVNIAARLQSIAQGGQILVKKDVYEKIKAKVEAEYIGKKQFKNISGEFDVYNIKSMK